MNLKTLLDTPPWEWPQGAGKLLLQILDDAQADGSDRIIAAELAGDLVVINEDLVRSLLSVVQNNSESKELRGTAAIALGPVLEHADVEGFEDTDEVPITESTFLSVQETLRELYNDAGVPVEVRRRILEASVRAPQPWHENAISVAYAIDDDDWKLTAVFSMRWVRGFDKQILEALRSDNESIQYEAVNAAGAWGLDGAWPHISALVTSKDTDKRLLLAAMQAVSSIRPKEAGVVLVHLADSDDEDIAAAAYEAMGMAEDLSHDDPDRDEKDDRSLS
ncbi:MAG: HEAT repeat domain-containing protein [Deltaproteobacteria bacterium]|nr:HEAT repeat domain-containing protein [Deltaproteobacteria bacterium]